MSEKTVVSPDREKAFIHEVLEDFKICCISRETSLLGRKEVLRGKAKFAILGDGKEVPQVAMARAFRKGDFRAGYYRDQTFAMAIGLCTVEAFFAQLYADPENDPYSGGRQMNAHFATKMVDENGEWLDQKSSYNITSDISPTAGQMARAVGLAQASKLFRLNPEFDTGNFSNDGNEVCFCTIGDASTSEGIFWESVNAAGVLQIPLAISVWDDGYGISVPIDYQTTKGSISEVLAGFQHSENSPGLEIHTARAWDYPGLVEIYEQGIKNVRATHVPAIFHILECTQPQGHSTSGSHERYKSEDRLKWERENDCIIKMQDWMISVGIATAEELEQIWDDAKKYVKEKQVAAWNAFLAPVKKDQATLLPILKDLAKNPSARNVSQIVSEIENSRDPLNHELVSFVRRVLRNPAITDLPAAQKLLTWLKNKQSKAKIDYTTNLYSSDQKSALNVPTIPAQFSDESPKLNGYEILNHCFDAALDRIPELVAFGEDVGRIGDVNQGFAKLQEKHGLHRVFDTGIREWSIMGQAIGLAMRGFRPIAEIQYLDYLLYGLTPLSDDLATLRYRSDGLQQAPAIIRTRGHRLEGIWHTGSPIGMVINSLRGMYVCVPRNMTQAAGFYNTLLQSNDPAIIIECLNGYRLKEVLPDNIGSFTVPLGQPDVLREGTDVTIVTYGSCVRIAMAAAEQLHKFGISVEVIDPQTLIPFDLPGSIRQSLQKTNRLVVVDEDVPGGASAYILQKILEEQEGYYLLDEQPVTITAAENRSPFGSDGDYFTKPNADDIFEEVYRMMSNGNPQDFPKSLLF